MPKNPYAETPAGTLRKLNDEWKKHHTWVSPDSCYDALWVNPENAIDDNEATAAISGWGLACGYTYYLYFELDTAIQCTKVRTMCNPTQSDWLVVDVFHDGSWDMMVGFHAITAKE